MLRNCVNDMTILLQIGCRPIGHIDPDQIYFSDLEEFGCYRKGGSAPGPELVGRTAGNPLEHTAEMLRILEPEIVGNLAHRLARGE